MEKIEERSDAKWVSQGFETIEQQFVAQLKTFFRIRFAIARVYRVLIP